MIADHKIGMLKLWAILPSVFAIPQRQSVHDFVLGVNVGAPVHRYRNVRHCVDKKSSPGEFVQQRSLQMILVDVAHGSQWESVGHLAQYFL